MYDTLPPFLQPALIGGLFFMQNPNSWTVADWVGINGAMNNSIYYSPKVLLKTGWRSLSLLGRCYGQDLAYS